jgi:hypothetical protein
MSETGQSTPETDEKKSRGLGSYVLWAFVAVMVYVLSSGPVYRFLRWEMITCLPGRPPPTFENGFAFTYAPLLWVYNHSVFRKPLGMYWHLWFPEWYDHKGESWSLELPPKA